ncbi:MAG: hypothetical protein R3D55_16545 [Chloroflexota bacterium]
MLFPRLYFLQDNEQLFVLSPTKRWVVNGPRLVLTRPFWRVKRRRGTTLGPTDYLLVRNEKNGELRNEYGPQLYLPGVDDNILKVRQGITLKKNDYLRIIDTNTGKIRVESGEKIVYLQPTEEELDVVKNGVNVDQETAVLIRNTTTGQLSLITEKQVFFPAPDEQIQDVRTRIKLEDREAIIIKDKDGRYIFRRGSDEERSFFLQPHQEIVKLLWSTGIHKDRRELVITKMDLRPKFMWYEFEARTEDNVELIIGITFFWEVKNLEKMIAVTDDAPGDICSHARSAIIQAISQVTLEQFLATFNSLIHQSILEGDKTFYNERGIQLHAVEVRSIASKDPATQRVLQEIINETTNRINRLQKQESENEVKLKQLQGDIESEEMRGHLLEIKRKNSQTEGKISGITEAERIQAFLNGLDENIPLENKLSLFNNLRKQEALEALSTGNAQLYFTPQDVDLTIRSG